MAKKASSKRGKVSAASAKTAKKTATKSAAPKTVKTSKKVTGKTTTRTAASRKTTKASASSAAVKTRATASPRPKKNPAGLTKRDLEHFRELLLEKRRELVGDMSSMEREALNPGGGTNLSNLPVHMADVGTDNYEQEFTLGLVEKDRNLLREINHALAKIQDGTYGICEATGKPIGKPRLEAQPWARYSIEHARELEKQKGRMR